jgi:phenylalanyl-tRNA synthetase alpha chain
MDESELSRLKATILAEVDAAPDLDSLEQVRVSALGKKGRITARMKQLGGLDPETRKATGQALNAIKDAVQAAIDARRATLAEAELAARLERETIDVSLPARPRAIGRVHPISRTVEEMIAIFGELGFEVAEGPHIEDDFHNFTALNIPPEHPARQEHDTFYLEARADHGERKVLRTHTSPVQIRAMRTHAPPLRVIVPGRTFRSDDDATHSPMFHQIEGLVVDRTVTMAHLKGTLIEFCRSFFGVEDLPVRFRPSYFPFTEPSAEVDIGCSKEKGTLKIGGGQDWLEILGCGMVHPKVLANCGIDPDQWQGYAFGMGIERVAMLKYGIPDLRTFYESDLRWLRHYGFFPADVPAPVRGL